MPKWTVTIPYYHRFHVEADTEEEAVEKAHSSTGTIVSYNDDEALVEEE